MTTTTATHTESRHRLGQLWSSTIGKKYVAAITGLILALFVVAHMLGNLKVIEGPGHGHAAVDRYGHFLRTVGSPVLPHDLALWIVRIVLILSLVLHIAAVGSLYVRNRRSKPSEFQSKRQRSTLAARTMPYTGLLVLIFLIFHIMQFTTRTLHPTALKNGLIYANAYNAFQDWWIVIFYIVAVVLLGFHLNHALWSGAQTAGVDNPDRNPFWRKLATGVTVVTVIGFALVPTLFWFGALPKPVAGAVAAAPQHTAGTVVAQR
jgi:succinate dehydrogenase / fumarate reductase cytochrome b subunit